MHMILNILTIKDRCKQKAKQLFLLLLAKNHKMRISLITIFLALLIGSEIKAQSDVTIEGIWRYRQFDTERVEGFRFMNDGRHFTRLVDGAIKKYDIESGDWVDDILTPENLGQETDIRGYEFSEGEDRILLFTNRVNQYRRSFFADYFVFDLESSTLTELFDQPGQMNANFSNDGKKVAFVYDNDLYFHDLEQEELIRVTHDGKRNEIINGASDWVYEEEFYITRTHDWSPCGNYLAFLKFDESHVSEYIMKDYNGELYPEYTTFKYPKVGEENSILTVWVYKLERDTLIEVPFEKEDFYIPRLLWTPESELLLYTMNRHQNHLELWLADPMNGSKNLMFEERNQYFISLHDNITFLEGENQFIWTSEQDGWNHIYLYSMDGELVKQLTQGEFDVTNFYGYDKKRNRVYFQAAGVDALNREVYYVDLNEGKMKMLTGGDGVSQASFSSTFDYYILNHSTANQPPRHAVFNSEGEEIRLIEENIDIQEIIVDLNISPVEFFQFTTSEDVLLNGYKIYPPDFDPENKYPVLMYQYSGPNSQHCINSWRGLNYWWFQMMARDDYIVVCVDGRGTGGRGEEFRKMTYLQLGHYETLDQIETAMYLRELDYVDDDAIGIFGWSYGGYISTLALLKGSDVFASAIAVAPVTNWKWYDTIYTERYMRTKRENNEGYRANSPVHFAHLLEGEYMIVHGLSDDNVHFQHTAEMVRALNLENKDYELYIYPNNNHSIVFRNARYHLYTQMTNFLNRSLRGE